MSSEKINRVYIDTSIVDHEGKRAFFRPLQGWSDKIRPYEDGTNIGYDDVHVVCDTSTVMMNDVHVIVPVSYPIDGVCWRIAQQLEGTSFTLSRMMSEVDNLVHVTVSDRAFWDKERQSFLGHSYKLNAILGRIYNILGGAR